MRIFNTFFLGGFECADHINRSGVRVNLLRETEHDTRVEEDYRLLRDIGVCTVREGLCWSSVERTPLRYDFSEVRSRIDAASRLGIQQIWDLCHFGYPDGLYPTHPHFQERFLALCRAFAIFYKSASTQQLMVVPVNEISFLSWHSGDVRGTVPFAINCGFDIKYHLCKAVIAGIKVLREEIPDCRVILVEPMIKVHSTGASVPAEVIELNETQFQAMDMIAGRMCPELEGSESCLDILGFNYYWDCQWEHNGLPLPWPTTGIDALRSWSPRVSLASLLAMVYARYGKPLFLAETGHFGGGRARWLEEVTSECLAAMGAGVDLQGICIYPVIDRPDWDDLHRFHNSGLCDLDPERNRMACAPYEAVLRSCVRRAEGFDDSCRRLASRPSRQSGPVTAL